MCDQAKTRSLNDAFRQTLSGGRVVTTASLSDRPDLSLILDRVRHFTDFIEDNDPYGEHDFGSLDWKGEKIFWKIDYCDQSLGSWEDPRSIGCKRVLTVMLASEY